MRKSAFIVTFAILTIGLFRSSAITIGQVDDFEGGTVQFWLEGAGSPNPPEVFPDDGPLGLGDGYLENASSGSGTSGSKLVMFNRNQWAGDYRTEGVKIVQLDAANFGGGAINLRLGLQSSDGTRWVSTNPIFMDIGTDWIPIEFSISEAAMTRVAGTSTLNQTLLDVNEMRFINRSFNAGWQGDTAAAVLGVDNIAAVPEATPFALVFIGLGVIGLIRFCRRSS